MRGEMFGLDDNSEVISIHELSRERLGGNIRIQIKHVRQDSGRAEGTLRDFELQLSDHSHLGLQPWRRPAR